MLRAWLTAKFAGTERAQHFHALFETEARYWRERGGKPGNSLHPSCCGLEGWVFQIKEQTRPQTSPSPHPGCVPLTNLGSWDSGEGEPLLVSEWEGEGAVAEDAAPAPQALLSSPSELPGKQSVAKPEAVEVGCVRDHRARARDLQRSAR